MITNAKMQTKDLAYVVTTSAQGEPQTYYSSEEAHKAVNQYLGKGYLIEIADSNFFKKDGKPKYCTFKHSKTNNTATITYFRYDLPEELESFLEDEAKRIS